MTSFFARRDSRVIVTVPVKDEAELLQPCLAALAGQSIAPDEILVFVNNSTDHSARLARAFARQSPVRVLVEDAILPAEESHAGGARRRAMQWAAARAGEHGILLTTDADGVVAPNWVEVNVAAIAGGAEAVAGRAILDPLDEAALPIALRDADASECHYAALLDEIDARMDPDRLDPLPRHDEHSGASIAVTMAAYLRAGGLPRVASGEDRQFFSELRRVDARIRHSNQALVTVSGRMEGRAAGGMADTIRRRMVAIDAFLDGRLEPAHAAVARIGFRSRLRSLLQSRSRPKADSIGSLALDLGLPPALVGRCLRERYFGAAWMMIEARSPVLRRRPVPATGVDEQIAVARNYLAVLDAGRPERERLA